MSKILDLLQEAREHKIGKYSALLNKIDSSPREESFVKQEPVEIENEIQELGKSQEIRINRFLLVAIFVTCLFSFLSALYMRFFLTSDINKEEALLIAKLDTIEKRIDDSNILNSGLKVDLESSNSKQRATAKEIRELKDNMAAQKTAIENLRKAKNNLFDRVTELESLKAATLVSERSVN